MAHAEKQLLLQRLIFSRKRQNARRAYRVRLKKTVGEQIFPGPIFRSPLIRFSFALYARFPAYFLPLILFRPRSFLPPFSENNPATRSVFLNR